MRPNAMGSGAAASTALCLCLSVALPTAIYAPPVPSADGEAPETMSRRYLRRAAAKSYDGARDGSHGSYMTSLVSLVRSTTNRDDGIGADVEHGHEVIDLGDGGDGQAVHLLRIGEEHGDDAGRRLQRASEKWYVDWYETKCVQSCLPTPDNPHCGGTARRDQMLFDTAIYCCEVALGWQPLEDCTETAHPDSSMSSLIDGDGNSGVKARGRDGVQTRGRDGVKTRKRDGVQTRAGDGSVAMDRDGGVARDSDEFCPPEYSDLENYVALDLVTIYITQTKGQIYMCKEEPLALYCDLFPPDWSRTAPGGGSVHTTDALGWRLLGECDGTQVSLLAPEAEDEEEVEMEEMNLDGVFPADSGLWPDGPPSGNMPAIAPTPDDAQLMSNFPALSVENGGGKLPPGKKPPVKKPPSASQPVGMPAQPPRPANPSLQASGESPSIGRPVPLGMGDGTEGGVSGEDGGPSSGGLEPSPASSGGGRPPSAVPGGGGSNEGPIGLIQFGTVEGLAGGDGGSDPSSAASGGDYPLIGDQPSNISGNGEGTVGLGMEEGLSLPSAGVEVDPLLIVDTPVNVVMPSGDGDGTSGPDAVAGGSSSSSAPPGTDYPLIGNKPSNEDPSPSNGDGPSGLGTEEEGSSSPTTENDPLSGKKPGKPKPSSFGDPGDGNGGTDEEGAPANSIIPSPDNAMDGDGTGADGDGDAANSIRPKPHRPGKPFRPFKPKPKPVVQVEQRPDSAGEEGEEDIIELNGVSCWRSGRGCGSDAEKFACCTQCINGICI